MELLHNSSALQILNIKISTGCEIFLFGLFDHNQHKNFSEQTGTKRDSPESHIKQAQNNEFGRGVQHSMAVLR